MLEAILDEIIEPGLALLPPALVSDEAAVLLLATGLQESRFVYRRELGGQGLGFWRLSGSMMTQVLQHPQTARLAQRLCEAAGIECRARTLHAALEFNDGLAAAFARLLLLSAGQGLPPCGRPEQAWLLYLRLWQPQHPSHLSWAPLYRHACHAVHGRHPLAHPA